MRALVVALALVGLAAAACGGPEPAATPTLLTALCEASAAAPADAVRIFERDVHRPLHDLAAQVTEGDRRVAARLLQAKNAVESAVEDPGSGLQPRLDELVAATRDALVSVGMPAPACPGGETQ